MLHLRDLAILRSGLRQGTIDPAAVAPIVAAALTDPGARTLASRLVEAGLLAVGQDRELAGPADPLDLADPELLFTAIVLERGLAPFPLVARALAEEAPATGSRDRIVQLTGIVQARRLETERIAGTVRAEMERVFRSGPDALDDPFLRFLRLSLEARLLSGGDVADLVRWRAGRTPSDRVRSWLGGPGRLDPEQAEHVATRFFGGGVLAPVRDEPSASLTVPGVPSERIDLAREAFAQAIDGAAPDDPTARPRNERGEVRADARTVHISTGPPEVRASLEERSIAGYQVLGELGRGGMGVVYRARQPGLDRFVALKVLTLGDGADGEWVQRFVREAQAAARLQHPNIVRIHDVGAEGNRYWFTMDLIEGSSLASLIDRREVGPLELARIGAAIARALHAAHEKGIVHRDVKPSNILVGKDGSPYLSDFGLALDSSAAAARLTRTGATLGTPPYMPPEQVQAGEARVDARSDVYSLGASLYEGLTGRLPFDGSGVFAIVRKVVHEDPIEIRRLDPRAPIDLVTIVEKAMEKAPARRYETALDLAADLERFVAGEAVLARPVSRAGRWARWLWRRKTMALAAASTAIVVATGLAAGAFRLGELSRERDAVARGRAALEDEDWETAFREFSAAGASNLEAESGRQIARREAYEPFRARGERARGKLDREVLEALIRDLDDFQDRFGSDEVSSDLLVALRGDLAHGRSAEIRRHLSRGILHCREADREPADSPRRDYDPAIREFRAALELGPEHVALRLYLVAAYLREAGRLTGGQSRVQSRLAARALDDPVLRFPSIWALRFLRGTILLAIDDYEEALADLSPALEALWFQVEISDDLGFPFWIRSFRIGDPGKFLNFAFQAPLLDLMDLPRTWTEGRTDPIDRADLEYLVRLADDLLFSLNAGIRSKLRFVGSDLDPLRIAAHVGEIVQATEPETLGRFLAAVAPIYAYVGASGTAADLLEIVPDLLASEVHLSTEDRELARAALALADLDPATALAHAEVARRAEPGSARARFRSVWAGIRRAAGAAEDRDEAFRGALRRSEEALAEDPADPSLHLARGVALLHLATLREGFELALAAFDDAIARAGGPACRRADLHVYRAAVLSKLNRTDEAFEAWQRAGSLDPGTAYLELWLRKRLLRVTYGGRAYEVERFRLPTRQFEYAEEAGDLAEKAARLEPILLYDYRNEPYLAWLASLRLFDLSLRLGRPTHAQVFLNLLEAGFDDEATAGPELREQVARYLRSWDDDVLEAAVGGAGERHADLAYYLQGLAWEVVRADREKSLDSARFFYETALRTDRVDHKWVRAWAAEAKRRSK